MTEAEKLLVAIKFIVDMYSSGATSAELALDQILNLCYNKYKQNNKGAKL